MVVLTYKCIGIIEQIIELKVVDLSLWKVMSGKINSRRAYVLLRSEIAQGTGLLIGQMRGRRQISIVLLIGWGSLAVDCICGS